MNPTGEYLFDHRNESLRQWILDELIDGKTGMGDPAISGGFANDAQGIWLCVVAAVVVVVVLVCIHVRACEARALYIFLVAHFENLPFSGVMVPASSVRSVRACAFKHPKASSSTITGVPTCFAKRAATECQGALAGTRFKVLLRSTSISRQTWG